MIYIRNTTIRIAKSEIYLGNAGVLGILGLGMLIVVLGRGIDLSMVAIMAISVAWTIQLVGEGTPLGLALAMGYGFALAMSCISGTLVAYAEIPAIFATLAMGTFVYGFGRAHLITGTDVVYLPASFGWASQIGQGQLWGIPIPIILAVCLAFVVFLFLRFSKHGWNTYNIGDNTPAARVTGIPVRPTMVMQYMMSGTAAYLAGLITATAVQSMNTRIVNSNMIYDVILIVVLGGVSLSGGARQRAQCDRRDAAYRRSRQRDDHHGHPVHDSERDQELDPSACHYFRQHNQPA